MRDFREVMATVVILLCAVILAVVAWRLLNHQPTGL